MTRVKKILIISILMLILVGCGKKEYLVKFDSDGGTIISDKVVLKGEKLTPGIPIKKGYKFLGWTLNGKNFDLNKNIKKNITLTAKWEEVKIKESDSVIVKFYHNSGSRFNIKRVKKGETILEPKEPVKRGYVFKGWYLDGESFDFDTIITQNINLIAKWEKE